LFSAKDGSIETMFKDLPFADHDLIAYDTEKKKGWYLKGSLLFEKNFARENESRLLYKANAKPVSLREDDQLLYLVTENETILFDAKSGDLLQKIPVKAPQKVVAFSRSGNTDAYLFADGLVEIYDNKVKSKDFFYVDDIANASSIDFNSQFVSYLSGNEPRIYKVR
jgi:hypothetical protein